MEDNGGPSVASTSLPSPTATPNRTHALPDLSHISTSEGVPTCSSLYPRDIPAGSEHVEGEQVKVKACLEETTRHFPRYLSNAMRRNRDTENSYDIVAAIWMTFPRALASERFECTMSLEVTSEKVEHLVWELFHVRTEVRDGLRYAYFNGAKALPNPKITFQGCRREAICSVFGLETANAIAANLVYQYEERQKRDRTDCVSMIISHQARDGAIIYI